jgi:hypothetical protein
VIAGCACLLAVVSGRQAGLATRATSSSPGAAQEPDNRGLTVEPERLHFGEQWEQTSYPWVLPIENQGSADIHIAGFSSSCNCTTIEPRFLTIPAGGSREVRLLLDLSNRCQKEAGQPVRDFRVNLAPRFDQAEQSGRVTGWDLVGRVRTAIRFETVRLDLGQHSEQAQPIGAKTIVTALVPLAGIEAAAKSPRWKAAARLISPARGQYEVSVTQQGSLPVEEVQFEVVLMAVLKEGRRLPGQSLRVFGRIVPDLQPSLPAVHFGARYVGEVAKESISLHSLTRQPFEVLDFRAEGAGLSVERSDSPGIESPTFRFRQRITHQGAWSGKAVFRVRDTGGRHTEVEVPVGYNGIQTAGG